jgi:glycosyltransferase involved in cell wall biosynthesis
LLKDVSNLIIQNGIDQNNYNTMLHLSIIIPVYNTEKFIKKCIDSCLNQNIQNNNYEIIIINDGSTDNSLEIINSYVKNNDNIHVFSQSNKKQGSARNNGLTKAVGEYIWFIDSDDWINENILKELIDYVFEKKPDILRFDAVNHFPNQLIRERKSYHVPNKIYKGEEVFLENKFSICVPFHLFKKSFLLESRLKFIEKIFFEDNEFMVKAFYKADKFQFYEKVLYNVRIRSNSSTRNNEITRKLDILKVIESHTSFLNQNLLNPSSKIIFSKHVGKSTNTLLVETSKSFTIFLEAINDLKKIKNIKNTIINSKSIFYIFEIYLINYPKTLRRLLSLFYKFKTRLNKKF